MTQVTLIGVPMDAGQRRAGCVMGPAAYRVAGLAGAIAGLGHQVTDKGDLALPPAVPPSAGPNPAVQNLAEVVAWAKTTSAAVAQALQAGAMPMVLGGDHGLALGSVAGAAAFAQSAGRPLFLLWLDAHSDFHTPLTTTSGNLHGTALALGARAEVSYKRGYPVTVNATTQTGYAVDVARAISPQVDTNIAPMMGAEDFSYMLNARPGAYIFVGNGDTAMVHHPAYNFDDNVIPFGASWYAGMVEARMPV